MASVRREMEQLKNGHDKSSEHFYEALKSNKEDIHQIAIALAGEYATRDDIRRVHSKLDKISDKLDDVPCKNGKSG